MTRLFPAVFGIVISLLSSLSLAAEISPDRVQFNHDIRIEGDENVGDVTCINCSVRVRGHVSGDVTAIAGGITAEPGASIGGDVTTIGGDTLVEDGAQVSGDLTAIGGSLRRDPKATIAGDVTTIGGRGWIVLIFLLPFLFLGGIIALIIWLVQRSRHPTAVHA
ncbi:MAG: hypothetical protein ACRD20_14315 [Terriglobales bacterium]